MNSKSDYINEIRYIHTYSVQLHCGGEVIINSWLIVENAKGNELGANTKKRKTF